MQIKITVDCTPNEARQFFGLPDLTEIHGVFIDQMKKQMEGGGTTAEFQNLMKQWMMPDMQKAFWDKFFEGMSSFSTNKD
ncbi:MAG: DUF6489 family protein [Sphingomonadales bacterium]